MYSKVRGYIVEITPIQQYSTAKPQQLRGSSGCRHHYACRETLVHCDVIQEIRPAVNLRRQTIVSVAAGTTLNDLVHLLAPDYNIYKTERIIAMQEKRAPRIHDTVAEPVLFRVVPNTAAEVLESVTFIASQGATEEQISIIYRLFSSIGYTMVISEKLIPAGTSLASCGIAFAMRYIRAAMEGGVELGFRPEEAERIV